MSIKSLMASCCFIFFLTGCSHNIQLNPEMTSFTKSEQPSPVKVGYYISKEDTKKSVTTPGGGGDSITYSPYKDTETVFYTVLANKFADVYKLSALDDQKFISDNDIQYIFIPQLETNSSSESLLTWPPTNFTISLLCKAIDSEGNTIWDKKIDVEGEAEFDEFKDDFSLAARRATEKALLELSHQLENEALFNTGKE